jgi:hypothetical protein
MERRKGSYSLNKAGRFQGRFTAFQVTSSATVTALVDTKQRDAALTYYINDSRTVLPAGTIIAARDAAQFTDITISGGSIDIIF